MQDPLEVSMRFYILLCEIGLGLALLWIMIGTGFGPEGWARRAIASVMRSLRRWRREKPYARSVKAEGRSILRRPDLRIVKTFDPPPSNNNDGGTVYHFSGPGSKKAKCDRAERPPPEKKN